MSYSKIRSKLFLNLHQSTFRNEHEYVTKMAQNVKMKGLEGDFVASFWIVEYFKRHIYVWNKILKHIMSQCGMDFRFFPLDISYNCQHFEPFEYVNGVVKFAPTLETNDPKVIINLDKFPSIPKSMV